MLLNEVISPNKIVKAKGRPKIPGEPLGSGMFAVVYPGRKTNTVIKVAHIKSPNDAYVNFIREALDHQDNLFFPRIYNAKLYEGGKKGYMFIVETERLVPLGDPKISDAIVHIFNQLGIDFSDIIRDTGEAGSPDAGYLTGKTLNYFETKSGRDHLRKVSDNQQFIEALDAFERLIRQHSPDLHANNMMARLTGTGPQLVLTDPVAFGDT